MNGILDTSVFIAREQRRGLGKLPDDAAISVLTIAELHLGVLVAKDAPQRAQRLRTLAAVEHEFDAIPIDDRIARTFAELVAKARAKGKRPKIVDAFIGATAVALDIPVYTQDAGFKELPGVRVVQV